MAIILNRGELGFIKAAGIKTIGTTLLFTLRAEIDSKANLIDYYYFLKNMVDDLKSYDNKDILSTTSLINKTIVQNYYSGDIADYMGKGEKLKFIDLKIDFRDKDFPYIFDGYYNTEINISYADSGMVNRYTFGCVIDNYIYKDIKQSVIEMIIILISSDNEAHVIVFKDTSMLEIIYPSGVSESSKPITKIEEKNSEDIEPCLSEKDTKEYIYIASNQYINALKIGCTKDVKQRLLALSSSTSVPVRFKLEYKKSFKNAKKIEKYILKSFTEQGYRVSPRREFFTIPLDEAINFINGINHKENI